MGLPTPHPPPDPLADNCLRSRACVAAVAGAALIALGALLPGCGGSEHRALEPVAYTNVTLTLFRPFAAGEYLFRSRAELQAALQAAPFRLWPIMMVTTEPPVPEWDFDTTMVAGLSRGEGPWCFAPRVTEVLGDGADVVVRYRIASAGTLACMLLAPQIAFVQVPRVPGRVVFERED